MRPKRFTALILIKFIGKNYLRTHTRIWLKRGGNTPVEKTTRSSERATTLQRCKLALEQLHNTVPSLLLGKFYIEKIKTDSVDIFM